MKGVPNGYGRPWTRGIIHQILTNEKYIGNNVYNRVSFKLKQKRVSNPPNMWIRNDHAFEAVIDADFFPWRRNGLSTNAADDFPTRKC